MSKLTAPFKTNDIVEVELTGLGSSGEGVGKVKGFTIFVPGGLPKEKLAVKIVTLKKNYAIGQIIEYLHQSPQRVEPKCAIYEQCGGCQLQHLSYEGQLEAKREQVKAAVERIGHIHDCEVLPVLGMQNYWNYRNKMQFPAALTEGKIEIGCYAAATHNVIDIANCVIQKEANNRVAAVVRAWMQEFNVSAYNEQTGKGVVRHVMARVGVRTGDVMAVLITSCYDIPHAKELVTMLKESVPGLKSIVQNINKKRTNIIMGNKTRVLYGSKTIKDKLGRLKFNISAQSFFQVNSEQAEKLYDTAMEYANLNGNETVIDCYCGTGTISLYLAQKAKKVYGVEIVAPAIEDANRNAEMNRIQNAEFILGDASDKMQELVDNGVKPDVVLLDPPRAGCDEKVLSAIVSVMPQRVVYVSCNPASLARDMAYLSANGYKAVKVQPVDLFPATHHVETVCLLSKLNAKQHIEINLDMDELDLTDAEKKATYQEIKDYVLEHSGLKVSSLYIAQVKQQCGIIERENYNKPKSEDAKQPQCPPDKEKAIKEALKYFEMI